MSDLTQFFGALQANNSDYSPGVGPFVAGKAGLTVDPSYQLKTRGLALTDEGGFRSNFCNSSLDVSIGNCTFTNGSDEVTLQTGSFDSYDINVGDYVYPTSAGSSYAKQVAEIDDNRLWLKSAWATTTVTDGATNRRIMQGKAGVGGTIAVANGVCVLTSGTTGSDVIELERDVDYLPITTSRRVTLSAAPGVNSTVYIGVYDETLSPTKTFARFKITGVGLNTLVCETGWNATGTITAAETESTTVSFQQGTSSSLVTSPHDYRTDVLKDRVNFWLDGKIVAVHKKVVPHPHDVLTETIQIVNGATGPTSYNVTVDYVNCANFNAMLVDTNDTSEVMVRHANQLTLPIWACNSTNPLIIDCSGYSSISFNIPTAGSASVITPAWSNDGVTFAATSYAFHPAAGGAAVATITNATAGLWVGQVMGRFLRLSAASTQTGGVVVSLMNHMFQPFVATPAVTATGVAGAAAHDAAVSGNPVRIAGKANTGAVGQTSVVANDTCDITTDPQGVIPVHLFATPAQKWRATGNIDNSAVAVTVKADVTGNTYVTGLQISWASMASVVEFRIYDGVTVIWVGVVGVPATNVPIDINFAVPLVAAGDVKVGTASAIAGPCYYNIQGYTGA